MTNERLYDVLLYGDRVGRLHQRGDYTWFSFNADYVADSSRKVLGLAFENNISATHSNSLRLPPWFSNLLPEGRLRDWIAVDRGVSADREMELLAQVGDDLPGAVQVRPVELDASADLRLTGKPTIAGLEVSPAAPGWRFSLAGVGLKFSMVVAGDRLTLPAFGAGGDWIVKLPDPLHANVPLNEFAMMELARQCGIEVPATRLVPQAMLSNLPENIWTSDEDVAYAIERFDRAEGGALVHIEDFAQVRNIYPDGGRKYGGSFETVAALCFRGYDLESLHQFTRRLMLNILISNGDAHLKNWSLIYRDGRIPSLSPAYDIVSTEMYRDADDPENLGLRFHKTRRFDQIRLNSFDRLQVKLLAPRAGLPAVAEDVVRKAISAWPAVSKLLDQDAEMQNSIGRTLEARAGQFLL